MSDLALMTLGLAVLAFASGMLGLGVAFAAIPFLSLFLDDLVHQVQPLSLLLNGVTALFSLFGFAASGLVSWRPALLLALVLTLLAPLGALLAQVVSPAWLWLAYFGAVLFLAWRLFRPEEEGRAEATTPRLPLALALAAPIAVLAGLLGVGPGFLLMPTLILSGFAPKRAAAINAFAVTPPSFSALLPHLSTARIDPGTAALLLVAGSVASFLGARATSLYVPDRQLKQGFGGLIVLMTAYKLMTLLAA